MHPNINDSRAVIIDYTNYTGERSERTILPRQVRFAAEPPWHPEPQWLLEAWDFGKDAWRTFAVRDIHSWRPAKGD